MKKIILLIGIVMILIIGCEQEMEICYTLQRSCSCEDDLKFDEMSIDFLPNGKCNCCAIIYELQNEFYVENITCLGGKYNSELIEHYCV